MKWAEFILSLRIWADTCVDPNQTSSIIIITRIAYKFATIQSNSTFLVSLKRRNSWLSNHDNDSKFQPIDGKLEANWIGIFKINIETMYLAIFSMIIWIPLISSKPEKIYLDLNIHSSQLAKSLANTRWPIDPTH